MLTNNVSYWPIYDGNNATLPFYYYNKVVSLCFSKEPLTVYFKDFKDQLSIQKFSIDSLFTSNITFGYFHGHPFFCHFSICGCCINIIVSWRKERKRVFSGFQSFYDRSIGRDPKPTFFTFSHPTLSFLFAASKYFPTHFIHIIRLFSRKTTVIRLNLIEIQNLTVPLKIDQKLWLHNVDKVPSGRFGLVVWAGERAMCMISMSWSNTNSIY